MGSRDPLALHCRGERRAWRSGCMVFLLVGASLIDFVAAVLDRQGGGSVAGDARWRHIWGTGGGVAGGGWGTASLGFTLPIMPLELRHGERDRAFVSQKKRRWAEVATPPSSSSSSSLWLRMGADFGGASDGRGGSEGLEAKKGTGSKMEAPPPSPSALSPSSLPYTATSRNNDKNRRNSTSATGPSLGTGDGDYARESSEKEEEEDGEDVPREELSEGSTEKSLRTTAGGTETVPRLVSKPLMPPVNSSRGWKEPSRVEAVSDDDHGHDRSSSDEDSMGSRSGSMDAEDDYEMDPDEISLLDDEEEDGDYDDQLFMGIGVDDDDFMELSVVDSTESSSVRAFDTLSAVDKRLLKFKRAALERNRAIRARQRERWERNQEGAVMDEDADDDDSGSLIMWGESEKESRPLTAQEEQEKWYSMISGASFNAASNPLDVYYESVLEKALLRLAKWTKDTPTVDKLFRPLDAIVDAVLTSNWGKSAGEIDDSESGGRRVAQAWKRERRARRRKYPLPVAQGVKYPLKMLDGSLRSRGGTIYVMNDKPGLGVKKKRKELRVQEILSAWYGDPAFPWVETVTDEDGTWIKVGRNTTDEMMSRVKNGVLIVPLPFDEQLGDPCPGTEKTLMINYTDIQGMQQTCVWDDGSIYSVSFLQAIRATYSPYRLANILKGDITEVKSAINETAPLIASLRNLLFNSQTLDVNRTYELEARLGFVQDGRGQGGSGEERARFDNGVSREFMDRVLDLCEEWDDWTSVSAWNEMHDFIFRVGSTQMRTTVSYDANLDEGVRRTVKKRIVRLKDFSYLSTLGGVPRTGMLSADVRIALSEETMVDEDTLPEWGKKRRPLRVRIKQRRSFNYTPAGASKPVWRFDFTLVWSAKTLKRAQLKQRVEEPNYELECELINPKGYLEDELDDRKVAKDLLLKLREFLEPWGGYRLEGVKNKSMNANRRYGKSNVNAKEVTKGRWIVTKPNRTKSPGKNATSGEEPTSSGGHAASREQPTSGGGDEPGT